MKRFLSPRLSITWLFITRRVNGDGCDDDDREEGEGGGGVSLDGFDCLILDPPSPDLDPLLALPLPEVPAAAAKAKRVGVRIVCVCNLWLLKREREKRFKKCIRRDR